MANTKAKGIVLEVGEPVELQQVITVTFYDLYTKCRKYRVCLW